jgi:hypothetical protein
MARHSQRQVLRVLERASSQSPEHLRAAIHEAVPNATNVEISAAIVRACCELVAKQRCLQKLLWSIEPPNQKTEDRARAARPGRRQRALSSRTPATLVDMGFSADELAWLRRERECDQRKGLNPDIVAKRDRTRRRSLIRFHRTANRSLTTIDFE